LNRVRALNVERAVRRLGEGQRLAGISVPTLAGSAGSWTNATTVPPFLSSIVTFFGCSSVPSRWSS
jgi:hypothetical protein